MRTHLTVDRLFLRSRTKLKLIALHLELAMTLCPPLLQLPLYISIVLPARTRLPPLSLGRWLPSFRSITFTDDRLIRPSTMLGL